jgi:hypothetical protein
MMLYLTCNTHPTLAFAINQVSRFANNPRRCHEQAVKRIGRYLKGCLYTDENGVERTHGTIWSMDPTTKNKPLQLDLYADADFCSAWDPKYMNDEDTARSRAGWIVMLKGQPLLWSSKLLTEICLSTAQAEYGALSSGMKALIPLRRLLFEIVDAFDIPHSRVSYISHAYEDNNAALYVATADPPRLTARSKHWNVKHHWFRSHLKDGIKVLPIDTADQAADTLTKGLPVDAFRKFRRILQGW